MTSGPRRARSPGGRLARWLRMLVCATLMFSLLPGVHALVEAVEHALVDGELPADHDLGCEEEPCSPLAHHCGCCASVAASAPGVAEPSPEPLGRVVPDTLAWGTHLAGPQRATPPPVRPPIG